MEKFKLLVVEKHGFQKLDVLFIAFLAFSVCHESVPEKRSASWAQSRTVWSPSCGNKPLILLHFFSKLMKLARFVIYFRKRTLKTLLDGYKNLAGDEKDKLQDIYAKLGQFEALHEETNDL